MYPSVEERIHDMQQRRINACVRLPGDHPLQPPMIEPLQFVPANAEVVDDQTGPESTNHEVSLSPSKPTTQTSDPFVIQDLINHYSGELPGFEPNLEKASELASDEIISECPQQQAPNLEMASLTYTDIVIHPKHLPYHLNATHSNISFGIALRNLPKRKQTIPEQTVPAQTVPEPFETNTLFAEPEISTNDQPSSSNLAIQTCAPARTTNVPSPPTLFVDSTILEDVCENIF